MIVSKPTPPSNSPQPTSDTPQVVYETEQNENSKSFEKNTH